MQEWGILFVGQEEVAGLEQHWSPLERPVGVRLAASYVNFLLTNGAVIMPAFGLPEADDRCALCSHSAFTSHGDSSGKECTGAGMPH